MEEDRDYRELSELLKEYFKKGRELYAFELTKLMRELPVDKAKDLKRIITMLEEGNKIEKKTAVLPIGNKGLILTQKFTSKKTMKVKDVLEKRIIS